MIKNKGMITYLKQKNLLCHDTNVRFEDRKIFCNTCQLLILDVNQFVKEARFLESCQVAHLFAHWTGDVNVPCKIQISGIPGIMPDDNLMISYSNLMNVIELLGSTNQEFIIAKSHNFNKSLILQKRILENFLKNYMTMISELKYDDESVQTVVVSLLDQMKFVFEETNVFDYFLNVLCPYVKSCKSENFQPITKVYNVHTPGELLMHLSQDATLIRKKFSKYCIPFDVIYIMIYCYLCSSNTDMVANFVFDLIVRICKGYFNETTHYQTILSQLVKKHITCKQNIKLHYIVNCMSRGEAKDYMSADFLEKYSELHQILANEFYRTVSAPTEQVQKYAFTQSFPYTLFPNSANYNGFVCMLGYVTKKLNSSKNAIYEKGLFSNAKEIFKFIENYTHKIKEFDSEGEPVPYWTTDIFMLFMSSDDKLVDTFKNIIQLLSIG